MNSTPHAIEQEHSMIYAFSRQGKEFKDLHRRICESQNLSPSGMRELADAYVAYGTPLPEADKRIAEMHKYAQYSQQTTPSSLSLNKPSLTRIVDNSDRLDEDWLRQQHELYGGCMMHGYI